MAGTMGRPELVEAGGQTAGMSPPESSQHASAADPPRDPGPTVTSTSDGTGREPAHPGREPLDSELRAVERDLTRMAALAAEAIERAVTSLADGDAEAAARIIVDDRHVNEMHALVQAGIVNAIATQQPVARDLRHLLAIDHVSYELERIGDYGASVAKQARKLAPDGPGPVGPTLVSMGRTAASLVRVVIQALVNADVERARDAAARDDEIDRLYHEAFAAVLDGMRADPDAVDRGARLLFAAHYLERIGDRVTNIAEDVVFLGQGTIEDLNG